MLKSKPLFTWMDITLESVFQNTVQKVIKVKVLVPASVQCTFILSHRKNGLLL